MNNPFSGIPLAGRRSTWELLPLVVDSMMADPSLTKDERSKRLGIGNKRMQAIVSALLAIGVLEIIRVPYVNGKGQKNTVYRHRLGSGVRRELMGLAAAELRALAYREFDRQFGQGGVPSKLKPASRSKQPRKEEPPKVYAGPHREAAEAKPGWPKELPCLMCGAPHTATHAGDRYHYDCRRLARTYLDAGAGSSGYWITSNGGRRPV